MTIRAALARMTRRLDTPLYGHSQQSLQESKIRSRIKISRAQRNRLLKADAAFLDTAFAERFCGNTTGARRL